MAKPYPEASKSSGWPVAATCRMMVSASRRSWLSSTLTDPSYGGPSYSSGSSLAEGSSCAGKVPSSVRSGSSTHPNGCGTRAVRARGLAVRGDDLADERRVAVRRHGEAGAVWLALEAGQLDTGNRTDSPQYLRAAVFAEPGRVEPADLRRAVQRQDAAERHRAAHDRRFMTAEQNAGELRAGLDAELPLGRVVRHQQQRDRLFSTAHCDPNDRQRRSIVAAGRLGDADRVQLDVVRRGIRGDVHRPGPPHEQRRRGGEIGNVMQDGRAPGGVGDE